MTPDKTNPRSTVNAVRVKDHGNNTNPSNSNPIDNILDRIDGAKKTGPDKWQARCPAHDDRSPSLSIKEGPDGTVLLKCWAGCSAQGIVEAVGLELRDLFPRSSNYTPSKAPSYSVRDVVKTVIFESKIIEIGYRTIQRGDDLSPQDEARVELAIKAIDCCRGAAR